MSIEKISHAKASSNPSGIASKSSAIHILPFSLSGRRFGALCTYRATVTSGRPARHMTKLRPSLAASTRAEKCAFASDMGCITVGSGICASIYYLISDLTRSSHILSYHCKLRQPATGISALFPDSSRWTNVTSVWNTSSSFSPSIGRQKTSM